jgi:hypothetical protein
VSGPGAGGPPPGWFRSEDCRLEDFCAVVETRTDVSDYPHAEEVRQGVVVYGTDLQERLAAPADRRAVQAELSRALLDGPGVVVFSAAFAPRRWSGPRAGSRR